MVNEHVSDEASYFFFSPRTKAKENGRQKTRFAAELTPGEFRTTLPEKAYSLKYLI